MYRRIRIVWQRYSRLWLHKLILWRIARIPERQFLYLLALVVGIFSGLAALTLKNLIHFVPTWLMGWLEVNSISYLFLVYPLFGILLTVIFVRYIIRDNIAHGVSRILYSISRQSSRIKSHNNWSSMVACSLTIGFGGSVGAEAPIVLTGASIGSNLARIFRLNYKYMTLMIGCGAAGAIAGIFNAPIAGIVFTLEVLMLDLTMAYLIPLLISSVTAAMLSFFFMGEEVLLHFAEVRPFSFDTIWFYLFLGLFTGVVAIYFSRMTMYLEGRFKSIKSWGVRLLIGGLIMGLLVFLFPPLWGEGYREIAMIFNGNGINMLNNSLFFSWKSNEYLPLIFLVGILIFKVIAMVATTGSGGVGGVFAPTLFMGAIAGYFFALLAKVAGNFDLPADNFALAGMAGMMAAVMHAPLTAIFLTAEMTRGYELIIPLIITSTVAYVTIMRFEPYSVYTKRLAQAGDLLTHHKDITVLRMMNVRNLIETDFEILSPDATLKDLVKAISVSHRNLYPVVDENGYLKGMVKLSDVRTLIFEHDLYDKIMVKDLMYMPEFYISPDDSMEKVAEKFESSGRYNLAVIEDGKYLGFISRAVAFSKYRKTVQDFSHE
jgi:chloride channel protein, CIC family